MAPMYRPMEMIISNITLSFVFGKGKRRLRQTAAQERAEVSQVRKNWPTCNVRTHRSTITVAGQRKNADLQCSNKVICGREIGCQGDSIPLRFISAPPTVHCVLFIGLRPQKRTRIRRAPPPALVRGCTSPLAPYLPPAYPNDFKPMYLVCRVLQHLFCNRSSSCAMAADKYQKSRYRSGLNHTRKYGDVLLMQI